VLVALPSLDAVWGTRGANNGVVNMMSLAQAPGIMTAVNNLTAADFFLAIAFQSWQNRCDEKKNCISNACRDHIALR
jgi:hypothetical protein